LTTDTHFLTISLMMKKRVIELIGIVLIMVLVIPGCGDRGTYYVADVIKAETIILKKKPSQGSIHSFSVIGSGEIHGNVEITLMLNDGPYKTEKLSGKVDFRWGGDWYSDQAEIRFTPAAVTGGSLNLRYEFKD